MIFNIFFQQYVGRWYPLTYDIKKNIFFRFESTIVKRYYLLNENTINLFMSWKDLTLDYCLIIENRVRKEMKKTLT